MPIVGYSPYGDAANLGQGLGDSFARLAYQLPQIKAQQLQQQAILKKLPYEVALDIASAQAQGSHAKAMDASAGLTRARTAEQEKSTSQRDQTPFGHIGNNPKSMVDADVMTQALRRFQANPDMMAAFFTGDKTAMNPRAIPNNSTLATPHADGPPSLITGQTTLTQPGAMAFPPSIGVPDGPKQPMAVNTSPPHGAIAKGPELNIFQTLMRNDPTMDAGDAMKQALSLGAQMKTGSGQPAAGGPQKVSSKAEYDKLPSGTQYIGPDGLSAVKK